MLIIKLVDIGEIQINWLSIVLLYACLENDGKQNSIRNLLSFKEEM